MGINELKSSMMEMTAMKTYLLLWKPKVDNRVHELVHAMLNLGEHSEQVLGSQISLAQPLEPTHGEQSGEVTIAQPSLTTAIWEDHFASSSVKAPSSAHLEFHPSRAAPGSLDPGKQTSHRGADFGAVYTIAPEPAPVTALCNRFDKDEHNHLLRHFFHIKQTTIVSEHVEQFSDIVHQLLAHDPSFPATIITNHFLDGLKKDEEASQDQPIRRSDLGSYSKGTNQDSVKAPFAAPPNFARVVEEKKPPDLGKTRHTGEDKLTALKNYRRSEGLCFKCGEKWGPNHKCPPSISLNAIEDIWKCIADHEDLVPTIEAVESDSGDHLMAISLQALNGIEGSRTIRLRANVSPWQPLSQLVTVRVANGEVLSCTHELRDQVWGTQGHSFSTTLKNIPIRGYDIILGMDWLETHSPMKIHWVDRWLQFSYQDKLITLQGIPTAVQLGPPVTHNQLLAFDKTDSILYLVQIQALEPAAPQEPSLPLDLQHLLEQFKSVFEPPTTLPPSRLGDHSIPLLDGAQPFCLRPYRYNPAQKTEIENQIADML
ncbi:unnamed protein product [Miscanthus lutarioriparius]|uniref:Uncharacterized protein n=1 Tax=Miscanthus lutarioriparius TaxID=422564 RepID=A0A811RY83_9POAL|nr:unnamed protein product [Miscanthus lutarioriparius]